MNPKKSFYFLFTFAALFAFQSLTAQNEKKDQLFLVHEETAKVSMLDQYENTSADWVKLMHEAKLDVSQIHASQRDDFHYYYLMPIANFAEIDNMYEKFVAARDKIDKDKWTKFYQQNESTIETHKEFVIRWSSEFSYVPKNPRLKQGEGNFAHWIFFNFKLEKRKEVMEVLKEWKKLYEEKNVPNAYDIWLMEIGENNNMIALTEFAKDAVDFHQAMDAVSKQLKSEEDELWGKLAPNILKIEQKYGKVRPDLCYYKK
ncbi:MAG: hypothetical protein FJ213_11390 [Ignavibacteria bacterium]|nr:hypothetical protein [Ignavibacteria bacterium]